MIPHVLKWLVHWFLQGLKLMLFTTVAGFSLILFYLPLALVEDWAFHYDDYSLWGKSAVIVASVVIHAAALAVFTAALANLLNECPLTAYKPKKRAKNDRATAEKRTNEALEAGAFEP